MELRPRPCSIPSPSPGRHGRLRHCRRAPSILLEFLFPFVVFATNSASSSCTHYTGSGTPTYTAGSTPQASSRRSTLTHGGYFAGRSIKGPTPNRSAMFLHPGFAVSCDGRKFPTTCSAPFPPPTPPHTPGMPPSSAGTEPEEHLGPIRRLDDTSDTSMPPNPLMTCEVSWTPTAYLCQAFVQSRPTSFAALDGSATTFLCQGIVKTTFRCRALSPISPFLPKRIVCCRLGIQVQSPRSLAVGGV